MVVFAKLKLQKDKDIRQRYMNRTLLPIGMKIFIITSISFFITTFFLTYLISQQLIFDGNKIGITNNFVDPRMLPILLQSCSLLTFISLLLGIVLTKISIKPISSIMLELNKHIPATEQFELSNKKNDKNNKITDSILKLVKDIDESKIIQGHLLNRLQAILDNTVDGLITINEKGIIEDYNKACEKIFGYYPNEVLGKNINMLMPEPYKSSHDNYIKSYCETENKKIIGIGREVTALHKNGTEFPVDLSVAQVMKEGEKRLFSGIVRDITERKKSEEELLRSNEELERFAYIASHDLQEPLRMVASFTNLLEKEYAQNLGGKGKEYMKFIIDGSHRMQSLIGDLLEYSKITNEDMGYSELDSKLQTKIVLTNFSEIIEDIKPKIIIHDLPVIHVNPIRFSRLMQNLIGNAIKYRNKDKTLEITISALENETEWIFSVSDNGIGIKKEYLENIFIIFKRLHGKTEYPGTGIGLAVCKKIVEGFNGKIWAQSVHNEGSSFIFTVPKLHKSIQK